MENCNKLQGLYLGSFTYTDKVKQEKRYAVKVLVWSGKKDNNLLEPALITVYVNSDLTAGRKIFEPVFVNCTFIRDFKTGYFRPTYSDISFEK